MSQQARISLSTKDVIHIEGFQGTASVFKNDSTVRIRAILQQLQNAFVQSGMDRGEINALMEQGIPCEVLQPNSADWQVGSLRLTLDFQPGVAGFSVSSAPMAGTIEVQNVAASAVVASAVTAPVVMPDVAPVEDLMELEAAPDLGADLGADFGMKMSDDLSDDLDSDLSDGLRVDLGVDLDVDLGADLGAELDSSFGDDGLGDLSIEGLSADSLDQDSLEMSGFTASDELGISDDLDLSGLDEMTDLSGMMDDDLLSDELSLGLDSQAVLTDNLDDLSNPWDMSGDLDDMLLQNSHS